MRRVAVLAAVTILSTGALATASPAWAAPKGSRGCPPPFTGYDLQEQLELAAELGVPESEVYAGLEKIDKNRDTVLCFQFKKNGAVNVIDNRSAHR